MKTIFKLITASIFLSSCSLKGNVKEQKIVIPDSVFSFFPLNNFLENKYEQIFLSSNAEILDTPIFLDVFDPIIYMKMYKIYDINMYDSLCCYYENTCINKFSSNVNNYAIIGSEYELLKRYDTLNLKELYLNIPFNNIITSFHEDLNEDPVFYDPSTISGLPRDYLIYILKSGSEFILPLNYRYDWKILPPKIKHGFRCGVAVGKMNHYIIYWVIAW